MIIANNKIDFDYLFKNGRKINGKYLITYLGDNNSDFIRPGVIASKKVGNAVERNRIKRLIREAVRIINKTNKLNIDAVIISKHSNGKNDTLKTKDIIEDLYNIIRRKNR